MATIVDLDALQKEIEADRKELERLVSEFKNELEAPILEKEAAYRYLVKRGDNPFVQKRPITATPSHLGENIHSSKPLSAEIKDILPLLGNDEFINADIENMIGREGIRSRITNELNKLKDIGILDCVHKGSGRTPSRFKIRNLGFDLA